MPRGTPDVVPGAVVTDVPGYSFYHPIRAAVDSPYVFVADSRDQNVAVFDWDLNFLWFVGRKGEGPDEFTMITDITVSKGVLYAANRSPARISRFSYEGKYLGGFPIEFYGWAALSTTPEDRLLIGRYSKSDSLLVLDVDDMGHTVGSYVQRAAAVVSGNEFRAQMCRAGQQTILAFEHLPRVVAFGSSTGFDYVLPITDPFPWSEPLLAQREVSMKRGSVSVPALQGGITTFGHYLLIGGPVYNLMVLDLSNLDFFPLQMRDFAKKMLLAGHDTYDDAVVKGDEILLLSSRNSCLIVLKIQAVLDAIHEIEPIPAVRPPSMQGAQHEEDGVD